MVWWKGGTAELERAALEAAPAVLAFGGQAAIATIARGARADAKLVLHGPKVSLAYVGKGPSRARAPSPRRAGSRSTSPSTTSRAASRRTRSTPSGGERDAGRLRGSDGGGARVGRGRSSCGTGACRRAGVGATLPRAGAVRRRGRFGDPARRARRRDALDGGLRERRALRARSGAPHGPRTRDHRPRGIRAGPRAFGRVRRSPRPGRGVPPPRGARRAALGIPRIAEPGSLQRPSPLGTHGGVRRLLPFVTWSTVDRTKVRTSASRPSGRGSRTPGRARRRPR